MHSVPAASAAGKPLLPPAPQLTPLRRRLFEVAVQLFGDRGYGLVSMRDLAGALGVTAAALYGHVAGKEELLFDIVVLGSEAHRDILKDALMSSGPDPVDQLRAISRAHVRTHLDYPALARVTNREIRALTDEHLDAVRVIRGQSEQLLMDVIERGVRLGVFDAAHPRLMMLGIAAMGTRTAEWINVDGLPDADGIADTFADYAVRIARGHVGST